MKLLQSHGYVDNVILTADDKTVILSNEELNDKHIYVAQRLLLKQFPFFKGLNSTLVHRSIGSWVDNYIQIMHCRMNHWITATTIGCEVGEVSVYDSLYSDIDNKTEESIQRILCMPDIKFSVPRVQKQNRSHLQHFLLMETIPNNY